MSDDGVLELPPYRAVIVVDTKDFGSNSDVAQHMLADAVPEVLARAFERVGLGHIWDNALFPHNTGDGFGIGFDTRFLPVVVTRFFDGLQAVLAERDVQLRRYHRHTTMRMRASINVGPVREVDPSGEVAVVGSTVITTHRLLDAQPVRDVLARSDPEQTFLSVAMSQRVFDDVLASEYATLPASRMVPRFIQVKEFSGTVYLYVPNPSGDLLSNGFGDGEEYRAELNQAVAATEQQPTYSSTNIMTGSHTGTAIQVGHLHGGLHNRDA